MTYKARQGDMQVSKSVKQDFTVLNSLNILNFNAIRDCEMNGKIG